MPLFDYICTECGKENEILIASSDDKPKCEHCGSLKLDKTMSVPSNFSGSAVSRFPGHGDTSCCGSLPSGAGCAGPGSCCGRNPD